MGMYSQDVIVVWLYAYAVSVVKREGVVSSGYIFRH